MKKPEARSQKPRGKRGASAFLIWLLASGFWLLSPTLAADTNQVYVRDSATAIEKFALAARMERLHEWVKAADVYQEVLAGYSDRVVPSAFDKDKNPIQYSSVVSRVQELLSHWPADGVAAYRARFGVEAQARLDSARPGDPSAFNNVFANYFITEAGRSAGICLVDVALEAGEFSSAAWTAQRLLDLQPDLGNERPMLLYRAALAYHFGGDDQRAKDRLADLRILSPAALGRVHGQDVVLVESLESLLASPARRFSPPDSGDSWRTAFGAADRARVAPAVASVGAALFKIDLGKSESILPRQNIAPLAAENNVERASGYFTGVYPAVDRGELYLQDNARVYAVNLESSLPLPGWAQTYQSDKNGCYVARGCVPMPRGQVLTVSLTDDSVLAIMGMSDAQVSRMINNMGDLPHTTRLVCLDRATGAERWIAHPQDLAANLREVDLIGSPLIVGQNVYLQARGGRGVQFEDSYVICLNLANGKLKWMTYVASGNISGAADQFSESAPLNVSFLAYSSGRVFCLTNLGAVAALGAYDGTIAWLNIYPREELAGAQIALRRMQPIPPRKPFIYNPVIVADQKVFVLPSDGTNLHVYDATSGTEVNRIPNSVRIDKATNEQPYNFVREQLSMLLGVVDGKITVAGDRYLFCLNLKNIEFGKEINTARPGAAIAWFKDLPISSVDTQSGRARRTPGGSNEPRILGRPFLSRDTLFVPTQSNLQSLSTRSGAVTYPYPADGWTEDEGPGNVLATSEYVILAGPTRLNVYTDLSLAMKRLDGAIDAAPRDPEPRLRFAEVMFITPGKLDLALNKLDEAIELMGGRKSLAPGPARDRLFSDLLAFARQLASRGGNDAVKPETIEGLYDRATDVAQSSAQNINLRLARADFAHANHDLSGEARMYQEILLQPAWRELMISRGDRGAMSAGIIATNAIDEILHRPDGRSAYEPFEKQANDLLDASRIGSDPTKLQGIAQAYPNSQAARAALLRAAELYESAGNARQAVQELRQVYARTEQIAPDRIRIIEALARNYLAMPNRLDVAAARLAQVAKLHEQVKLSRPMRLPDGQILKDATFAQALEAVRKLQAHLTSSALPDLNLAASTAAPAFAPAEKSPVIEGVAALCLPPQEFSRLDRVVAFSPASGISIFSPGGDKPICTNNALADQPRGVAWTGGNLLAWSNDKLVMLDADSGRANWTVALAALPAATELAGTNDADDDDSTIAADTDANDGFDGQAVQLGNGQRVIFRGGQIIVNGRVIGQRQIIINGNIRPIRGNFPVANPVLPAAPVADPAHEQIVSVVPLGDRAIVSTTLGRILAVDLGEGAVLWQSRPARAPIVKLLATDEFVAVRINEEGGAQLIALDTTQGQIVYRRRYPVNAPSFLVNFALADDGTLVWVLPDRIVGKDLFEPGDLLRFGERGARGAGDGPFVSAVRDDQIVVTGGKILLVGDGGAAVHAMSLENGAELTGQGTTPLLLQSGGDPDVGTTTKIRAVGAMAYITTTAPPKLSAYDLDRPGAAWDTHAGLAGNALREILVGRNDLLAVSEISDVRHTQPGHFQIVAYTRQRTPAGIENGMCTHVEEFRETSGITTWQAVDGGIYYLAGDQKLHFLAGAGSK